MQHDSLGGVGGCGCESEEGEPTLGAAGVEGRGVGGCGCGLAEEGETTLGAAAVEGGGIHVTQLQKHDYLIKAHHAVLAATHVK